MMYYSICAIAKNEHLYLEDWVCSNLATGAEHFFIYDNDGQIPVKESLKQYIDAGIVTVVNFPGKSAQMPAYTHALFNFGKLSKWIAFIDCDEICIPREKNSVQEILPEYEKFGGFNVSWRIFGANGHKTKPDGIMMENYTACMTKEHYESTHTKAIVQPEKTLRAGSNPHHFIFKPGFCAVSEDFKIVPNAWTPHCSNKLQLNHYFTKSFEEFKIKVERPRADDIRLPGRKIEDFFKFDNLCTDKDEYALKFVDKAKSFYIR